ncbi:hypothetical protein BD289DRAFT_484269 [Coniella lustricola]|uniref:WW domain-containing protein n=1 Tax=Coniella lustricola TaxID=2025994 RepID=A0A2T3A2I6_9PEZI|nr:hypothetical protein BD289DRAFT_484269 [Coniella lustricola]
MADRSRGIAEEELFMNGRPAERQDDSPTIEPLRIFKPQSPPPSNQSKYAYPVPASSSAASSKLAFPLPPGASSSAAPLPYPDEDDYRVTPAPAARPAYTTDSRKSSAASSRIHRTDSPASSASGGYNDTSPRLNRSPVESSRPGLAERRGTAPKPIVSPTSPKVDRDELFAKPLQKQQQQQQQQQQQKVSTAYQNKSYYPPPGTTSSSGSGASGIPAHFRPPPEPASLGVSENVNRFPSTASNSTTRASRGSPPPPETPIVEPGVIPGGGIEARYAAAGISGTATLTSLQAQSAAASQRLAHYGGQPPQQPQPTRPWTPTDDGSSTHSPPTVYQGATPLATPISSNGPASSRPTVSNRDSALQVSVLEQDFQRMQASTPPPAYTTVNGDGSSGYPREKQRPTAASRTSSGPATTGGPAAAAAAQHSASTTPVQQQSIAAVPSSSSNVDSNSKKPAVAAITTAGLGLSSPGLTQNTAGHPAFANDPRLNDHHPALQHTPSLLSQAQSPPPLPEGWIAHLDQNSGQYYYIHLATQATQWEFPKGPTPIQHEVHQTPLSPVGSTYGNPLASPFLSGKQSLSSPLYPPSTPGYAESIMSVATATPSTAGFTGPPPSAGVDMFKVTPTNGVYFGPYLRYGNMDVERGLWLGSIMIVTDAPQPPTIHLHLSVDLSPNPRQLIPQAIYTHQRWTFYRYSMDLKMGDGGSERWTYAVTSHLGCTRYEFVVAGRYENGWRFVAHSGNDFSVSTSQNERAKVGGPGLLWKDVLQKNVECGGFHAQLGLGGQIYGDRLWREVPLLRQWLSMQGRENRKNAQWTARHEEDVSHAYFHYYTSHFDQPFLREAFAQIPHILQINDHDIFDGFGSYPDYMQQSAIFKNIGRIAIEMYLLFQHHTTVEMLRNVNTDTDLFTVTGTGWHFLKYLGPSVVVVGPDLRSERNQHRVMAGPTYQGIFPKVAMLPPSVQHCIWMLSVPVIYPRLDTVETLANTFATGKKAVNSTYNLLGKATSSVAGIIGGKEIVQQGFTQVKKAVGKSGLMGNVLNQFGDFDIAEELKDLWTHESKDLERTYLIRTLQGISQQKGIRMTFLSGDVNCAGAGLVHDPSHPSDHKTMYQITTSPIVAAPAGNYILKMLHNNRLLYVPANGHKSTHEVSDTKEDMMEIFHTDASGATRELKKLMGRRNYAACIVYDPELLQSNGSGGTTTAGSTYAHSIASGGSGSGGNGSMNGLSKLSLAFDFVVQGDGHVPAPTKYGPVIVPHLEFGH